MFFFLLSNPHRQNTRCVVRGPVKLELKRQSINVYFSNQLRFGIQKVKSVIAIAFMHGVHVVADFVSE